MINPFEITNFNRNNNELQEFLLFAIIVAGKTAYIQSKKLDIFLNSAKKDFNLQTDEPFKIIRYLYENNLLEYHIKNCKLGQYRKTINAFSYILSNDLDLKKITTDELEKIPGVGPKTSRFFALHSRNDKVAVLDVHILKWISSLGYDKVPKTTPGNPKIYKKWEQVYLNYCNSNNLDPAQLDLEIWKSFAKKDNNIENQD